MARLGTGGPFTPRCAPAREMRSDGSSEYRVEHLCRALLFRIRSISSSVSARAEQIPAIARDIEEDGDLAVRLRARLRDELDSEVLHLSIRRVEVIDPQKETDAASHLVPDRSGLLVTIRLGEENAGDGARRTNDDPALRSPVVGRRWRIVDELEPERIDEEANRAIVVSDDDRHEVDGHGRTLPWKAVDVVRSAARMMCWLVSELASIDAACPRRREL